MEMQKQTAVKMKYKKTSLVYFFRFVSETARQIARERNTGNLPF